MNSEGGITFIFKKLAFKPFLEHIIQRSLKFPP